MNTRVSNYNFKCVQFFTKHWKRLTENKHKNPPWEQCCWTLELFTAFDPQRLRMTNGVLSNFANITTLLKHCIAFGFYNKTSLPTITFLHTRFSRTNFGVWKHIGNEWAINRTCILINTYEVQIYANNIIVLQKWFAKFKIHKNRPTTVGNTNKSCVSSLKICKIIKMI